MIGIDQPPVSAYLNINEIISIAKENNVSAIHPGYGFLSENSKFAEACERENIIFIGPTSKILKDLGDKTIAKSIAKACNVKCIPGTEESIQDVLEAKKLAEHIGFPVIIKASFGGGGRGMRIARDKDEFENLFNIASSEAKSMFGNGSLFIEKYLENPRHIEVQIIGDGKDVIHLFERDCSVQRRHQKVVEIAPAYNLDPKIKNDIIFDAIKIAKHVNYNNVGTVEFLLDQQGNHYFIEVNPRIQVEHTVTEEITGIDIVHTQIKIANGKNLKEIGLTQDNISQKGFAIQCRVTTEDPEKDFQPDTGVISVYRPSEGSGIRLDSASAFQNINIGPHYDSLLTKVTARGLTFDESIMRMKRALSEFRIRGLKTNIPFLKNVIDHEMFREGKIGTEFIKNTRELFKFHHGQDRAQKLLSYLGNHIVNGTSVEGANMNFKPINSKPQVPKVKHCSEGWRDILLKKGTSGFSKAIREHQGALLTDTTMRDAHQSLLMTRMRTKDLLPIAPLISNQFKNFFSLEVWGGATFDVSLRFLHECPWKRLTQLRNLIPNIPFQMLLRGANAVGYTSYPDNLVYKFCQESKNHGIDIFRVFDSLNYIENLKLGIDAAGASGAVVEAAICYTGDLTKDLNYNLEYYLKLARRLIDMHIDILCIKDMAGLLTPQSAHILVTALRKEFPEIPIHIHTHDTAGTGVISMVESLKAGADIIDVAIDSFSGMTSQPSMGAIIASLSGTSLDTFMKIEDIQQINEYWEQVRSMYAPFESGQKSGGSDVYIHEMPGGQYTNLLFQSQSLGLSEEWSKVKKAYAEANRLLGGIIKVTPSSKVVGDLAQFMVSNNLSENDVRENAKKLDFPSSVIEYFQGHIGQPNIEFPEPLRTDVLKGQPKIEGRPGSSLKPFDFIETKIKLQNKYNGTVIKDSDVLSYALYPKVFEGFMENKQKYGDLSILSTFDFIKPLDIGQEIEVEIERGKILYIKYVALGDLDQNGQREVFFEVNGLHRSIKIDDKKSTKKNIQREKADPSKNGSIGCPMTGVVIDVQVKPGQFVKKDDPLLILSAMKMETVIRSHVNGKVTKSVVKIGDEFKNGDLLFEIDEIK